MIRFVRYCGMYKPLEELMVPLISPPIPSLNIKEKKEHVNIF